jgi:hypothetical protein
VCVVCYYELYVKKVLTYGLIFPADLDNFFTTFLDRRSSKQKALSLFSILLFSVHSSRKIVRTVYQLINRNGSC